MIFISAHDRTVLRKAIIGCLCASVIALAPSITDAQVKKVRVAVPGYTIAVLSFLAAKMNGYYMAEGLDVELIAMRAPTANLAVLSGNVEFSAVPLAGLTTALRGAPLKLLFCQFDKPQHALYARAEVPNIRSLRGKKLAVSGLGTIDDILLRDALVANGVDPQRDLTILAMGGVLLPMLLKGRYTEANAIGLVTVSGSIGVMLPPSLPVILYAYYAEIDLEDLFVAGIVPGIVLVVAVAAWAAWRGVAGGAVRTPFSAREYFTALWRAKWEVLLPFVVMFGIFGGYATLVETAALTVVYALVLECVVFKELPWRDVVRVSIDSTAMIGGFMIILGIALGFTNYLIIAQVPMHILDWVRSTIESPLTFLLLLNLFLVVVGAVMDIYSAIIVIVPLIVPMASAFGIHPAHLGIIFLANMQLGYLMPPMGENLFLSAYRFNKPLAELYRYVTPFVGIIAIVVLLITYVPALTLWLIEP